MFEISLITDFLFKHSIGKLSYFNKYAPDIEIINDSDALIANYLQKELKRFDHVSDPPTFLDIGSRDKAKKDFAMGYDYKAMDINPRGKNVVVGDICKCPEINSDTYDVTFSMDVFEHLQRPWDAAEECIRITKPGGLMIHRTLFAYRYHPEPVDYWRFSSQCLEYLFINSNYSTTLVKGYDIRGRRRNRIGIYIDHRPPIDWMGGFRENWQVLWIGRKIA